MSRPMGKKSHRTLKQEQYIQDVPKSLYDGKSLQPKP